jgi:ribonuclease J
VVIDRATGDILSGPDIISRGFLHPEDSEELFEEARHRIEESLDSMQNEEELNWDDIRISLRDIVTRYLKKATGRRPVVVPVVMEL